REHTDDHRGGKGENHDEPQPAARALPERRTSGAERDPRRRALLGELFAHLAAFTRPRRRQRKTPPAASRQMTTAPPPISPLPTHTERPPELLPVETVSPRPAARAVIARSAASASAGPLVVSSFGNFAITALSSGGKFLSL